MYSDIQTDFLSFFTYNCENLYICTYALATHVTYILLLPVLLLSSKYHWKLKQELTFRRKFLFIWFKQGHNFLLRFYHAIFMTWDNALNFFQFRLSVSTYTNSEWASIKKGTTNFRGFPPSMKCSEQFFHVSICQRSTGQNTFGMCSDIVTRFWCYLDIKLTIMTISHNIWWFLANFF